MRKLLLGSLFATLLTGCYTVLQHPDVDDDPVAVAEPVLLGSDSNRCASCHGQGLWYRDIYPSPWPRYVDDDPWWWRHDTGEKHRQGDGMDNLRRFQPPDPVPISSVGAGGGTMQSPPLGRVQDTSGEPKRDAAPEETPRGTPSGSGVTNPRQPAEGAPTDRPRQDGSETPRSAPEPPFAAPPPDPPPAKESGSSAAQQGHGMSNDRGGRPRP
jgi:hypothetical protein